MLNAFLHVMSSLRYELENCLTRSFFGSPVLVPLIIHLNIFHKLPKVFSGLAFMLGPHRKLLMGVCLTTCILCALSEGISLIISRIVTQN